MRAPRLLPVTTTGILDVPGPESMRDEVVCVSAFLAAIFSRQIAHFFAVSATLEGTPGRWSHRSENSSR